MVSHNPSGYILHTLILPPASVAECHRQIVAGAFSFTNGCQETTYTAMELWKGLLSLAVWGVQHPFGKMGLPSEVFGEYLDNHLIIFCIDIHYNSSHLIYLQIHQLSLPFEPPAPNQGAPEPSTSSAFALLRFSPTQIYETNLRSPPSTRTQGRVCGVLCH